MLTVPGQPNSVLIHENDPRFSPTAVTTVVYDNAMLLPDHIGNGVGVGGPDIFTIDPTNGTRGYSYDNTDSSFGNGPITIGPNGVDGASGPSLGGVLTGAIGPIALIGDRLFVNTGAIYSISLGVQVGAFQGGDDFVFDPANNKFFSLVSTGSSEVLHAYSLSTLAQLGTQTFAGISGSTGNLTRFSFNGLGFRTSNGQIVFVESQLVPEPSALLLGALGIACLGTIGVLRSIGRQRIGGAE